jgi:hypothetical protein
VDCGFLNLSIKGGGAHLTERDIRVTVPLESDTSIHNLSSITAPSITTLLDSQREQPSSTVSVHPEREKPGGVGRVSGGEESHFRQNGHLPSIDCSRPLQLRSMNLASRILVKTTPAALLSHTFSPLHCASHTSTDQR